ncbi:hypothetical protein AgCh_013522 [Apium graveolens]
MYSVVTFGLSSTQQRTAGLFIFTTDMSEFLTEKLKMGDEQMSKNVKGSEGSYGAGLVAFDRNGDSMEDEVMWFVEDVLDVPLETPFMHLLPQMGFNPISSLTSFNGRS